MEGEDEGMADKVKVKSEDGEDIGGGDDAGRGGEEGVDCCGIYLSSTAWSEAANSASFGSSLKTEPKLDEDEVEPRR